MRGDVEARRTSRLATLLQVARARPRFAVGYAIVLAAVVAGVLAPLVAPYARWRPIPPNSCSRRVGSTGSAPTRSEWISSAVIYAPRIDLAIALAGTLLSAVVGCLAGAWVGYYSRAAGSVDGFPSWSCGPPT